MDPAMAIAREQQVCPFAMQCLVGIPAKAFGQVGAQQRAQRGRASELGVDRYQFQTCHSLCGRWALPKTYID